MLWEPGQSGNPKGAPKKEKRFLTMLERAIAQDDAKRLRAAAEKLLDLAAEGEQWAVEMLAERLDGKATQDIKVNIEDEFTSLLGALASASSEVSGVASESGEICH